jgi:hypothetical protein
VCGCRPHCTWIEDDDGVCSSEVDADATSARGEQECEHVTSGLVEAVNGGLALVAAHGAIEALVPAQGAGKG